MTGVIGAWATFDIELHPSQGRKQLECRGERLTGKENNYHKGLMMGVGQGLGLDNGMGVSMVSKRRMAGGGINEEGRTMSTYYEFSTVA